MDTQHTDLKTFLKPGMKFFYIFPDGEHTLHEVLRGTNSRRLKTKYILDEGVRCISETPWDEIDRDNMYMADIRTPLDPEERDD